MLMMANGVVLNVRGLHAELWQQVLDRSTIPSEESQRSVTVMPGWHSVDLIHQVIIQTKMMPSAMLTSNQSFPTLAAFYR